MSAEQQEVCIYESKDRARAVETVVRHEIAEVLKAHGVIASVIVLALAHKQKGNVEMHVGIEGAGSPLHTRMLADDLFRPGLFDRAASERREEGNGDA